MSLSCASILVTLYNQLYNVVHVLTVNLSNTLRAPTADLFPVLTNAVQAVLGVAALPYANPGAEVATGWCIACTPGTPTPPSSRSSCSQVKNKERQCEYGTVSGRGIQG